MKTHTSFYTISRSPAELGWAHLQIRDIIPEFFHQHSPPRGRTRLSLSPYFIKKWTL